MVPPVFYKYMTSNTAKLVLQSERLRWSSPLIFNDIAEFQRMPKFKPTLAESLRSYPETIVAIAKGDCDPQALSLGPHATAHVHEVRALLQNSYEPDIILQLFSRDRPDADTRLDEILREHTQQDISAMRVMCLTTTCDNDVMWGLYAESNKGCVLGFQHLPELSTPLTEAKKVTYSTQAPTIGSGMDFLLYGHTAALRKKTVEAICYTKKSDWAYEQEWRAITKRNDGNGRLFNDFKYYSQELESVTFGSRATEESISEIVTLVTSKYPHALIYKMISDKGDLVRLPLRQHHTQI